MKNKRGQSIVELTLMTPLLLLALYVPFDFGLALYTASLAQSAVRDVARKASTYDTNFTAQVPALRTEITSRLPGLALSPTATVIRRTSGSPQCMQYVEASVTYTYNYSFYKFARLFGLSVPDTATVTRTSRMRYEFQPDSNGGPACTAA